MNYSLEDYRKACNICDNCILKEKEENIKFVPFEIVGDSPKVVLVGEGPGFTELEDGRPFIGRAGMFLRDELERQKLDSYILANSICCHPRKGKIRTPTREETSHCSKHVLELISTYGVDKVILLGGSAARSILPESYTKGKSITNLVGSGPVKLDGVSYAVQFHPSYIIRNGGIVSKQYKTFSSRFKQFLKEVADVKEEDFFEIVKTDDLKETLVKYKDEKEIGFDYEGSGLDPWNEDFTLSGFSISTLSSSTYVSLDRQLTSYEISLFLEFLKGKEIWVYNLKYELAVTKAVLGQSIDFNDASCLCKIDCRPVSLKENARYYLSIPIWEEETQRISDHFEVIFKKIAKSQKIGTGLIDAVTRGDLIASNESLRPEYEKYISVKDIEQLETLITPDELSRGLSKYPKHWLAIPERVLGKYCCYDSKYTLMIKNSLWPRLEKYYPFYIRQTWLASVMEDYGIFWNDDVASELKTYYFSEANQCLSTLITDYLVFSDDEGNDKTDEVRLEVITDKKEDPEKEQKRLKAFFNPNTPLEKNQAPFWNAYKTNRSKAVLLFHDLELAIAQSREIPDDLTKVLIDKSDISRTIENFQTREKLDSVLKKVANGLDSRFKGFSIPVLDSHYKAFVGSLNISIDFPDGIKDHTNEESGEVVSYDPWPFEFRMLYLLKRFKKVMKSYSTYIKGKLGRESVSLVRFSDYDEPPRRFKSYTELQEQEGYYELKEGEAWVLNTSFFENSAITKRWRAGIHTIPANCELRGIYSSRRPNGLICHFDYKQMEVRTLAAIANVKGLLEAFEQGRDTHKYIASFVFNRSEDLISEAERRYAKTCTFALLYGKTVEGVANEYMGGDIRRAKKLFSNLFEGLPEISRYIESSHKEVIRTNKVSTLFGDSIYIENMDEDAKKREAQNYRIQSTASSISALSIWRVYEECKRRQIKTIPVNFTHDSSDMDFDVSDLFELQDVLKEVAIGFPREVFNVPVDIDIGIGVSQENMMEMNELGRTETSRIYEFKCAGDSLSEIIRVLESSFVVEKTIQKEEEKYISLDELFAPKRAFSRYYGNVLKYYKGLMRLTKK